ncbi:hypothetical protein HGM15179_011688 [Zosterops borbonicus]|uniref:Uncharacterized protein n=1 Tax=Zosterops borbonicus TaxID=364589 RepID=A0A8K1GB82_9PASS|nr:hypothetical protein HGM15179_011688 [Zosterops borbonicus]
MDHIDPQQGGHQSTLCNGHGVHSNWKMRSFNIRSLNVTMPLEDTQQKKLGEPLGVATEGFRMGRRLTSLMEPSMKDVEEKEQPDGWPSQGLGQETAQM